ncbi:HEAT repeat domain-containing protein [Chryseosolibacter indicus]|uniref:HEAT repeat domain-containing protein n=1 Tax=Chryseosolibacter indicus TaxID=2782351 RepID=A0ABS5VQY1_9BACT|nr:HEAT repeat domain-containing protein [Chryseosolibacter indicus]MBT1703847.1 HEAT repeat domain-containing protein [Chryseosolibacter indicus]
MEREKLESLIIDYIDNRLNSTDRRRVEQELVDNAEAYRLYEELKEVIEIMDGASRLEPSEKLKYNFEAMLGEEVKASKKAKTIIFQPMFYRAAAAVALLVLGCGIGFWISEKNEQQQRLLAIENEMKATKLMMMSMLDNSTSASQRMQGVNVALNMNKADDEIVRALVKAMNEDPNSNVRLAALDALSNFSDDAKVRSVLIQSLETQKDPLVQIALIQLMVKMKEKAVIKDLQKMVNDTETMQVVKDEAYSGIMKLS